jgi:hypothetical protein
MFYGSILFRFIGVFIIWIFKSIFRLKLQSFKNIWQGEKTKDSDDLTDHASNEIIQIFVGFLFIIIFGLLINRVGR